MESAGTPARARASRMATAPRSTAWSALNPPANFPMGVRAPATMTERSLVALMAAAPAARVSVPVYGRPCVRRAGPRVDARMNRRRCWPRVKPGVSMSPSDGQGGCHGAHRDAPVLDRLLHLAAPVDRVDGRAHPQSVVGLSKADGIFAVLALGSLLMMIGVRMYESSAAQVSPGPHPGGFTG